MKKKIFKNNFGDIHFGSVAPTGFEAGALEDVENVYNGLDSKKFWRCTVCNDLSIALEPLEECPTCRVKNPYIEIDYNEFKKLLELL